MFARGDIVSVPFPFTDLSRSKLRPAIVLSNDRMNSSGDVIVAMITSKDKDDGFSIPIPSDALTIALPRPSYIRFNRVVTLDESLIDKKLSEADISIVGQIVTHLQQLLSERSEN
jgi:mRNA interferase MazF